jgi:hypothetical protein
MVWTEYFNFCAVIAQTTTTWYLGNAWFLFKILRTNFSKSARKETSKFNE